MDCFHVYFVHAVDRQGLQDLEVNQGDRGTEVFQEKPENEVRQDPLATLVVTDSLGLMGREVHRDHLDPLVPEGHPDPLEHQEPRVSVESGAKQEDLDSKDDRAHRVNRDLPDLKDPQDHRVHLDRQETGEHRENVVSLAELPKEVHKVIEEALDNLVLEAHLDLGYVIGAFFC